MAQYTLTNLIPTHVGDSAWSAGTLSTTHVLYSSKSLQLTGTTSTNEVVATYQAATIPQVQNHIYYSRIYEYHESSSLNGKGWQVYWPAAEPYFNSTPLGAVGQWNMLSARNVRSNWASANQAIRVDFDNAKTAGSVWYDGFMMIDLTATFGAGNEPNQEWCDKTIPFFIGSKVINASLPVTYDLSVLTPTSLKTGDIVNCPYTGNYKTLNLKKGTYKLECWGAEGGNNGSSASYGTGGKGGYSVGTLTLQEKLTTMYLYAGGQGATQFSTTTYAGGFNGGGSAQQYAGSGGGASDIRIGTDSLYSRVIVAGGGGGAQGRTSTSYKASGGAGGGTSGQQGGYYGTDVNYTSSNYGGPPGTQTAAGTVGNSTYGNTAGAFGVGGNGGSRSSTYRGAGAGGGGWYGGGTGYYRYSGGGGGSGYVYTSSTASSYPSGCTLNSSYYLTGASTTAGNVSFTSPTGTAETGHSGNGYIRITAIDVGFTVTYDANGGTGAPADQAKDEGVTITLSTVKPTKASILSPVTASFYKLQTVINTISTNATESFTFTHWNTAPDGTGKTYMPGDSYDLNENLILYAQYTSSFGPAEITAPSCDGYTDGEVGFLSLYDDAQLYTSIPLNGTLEYNFAGWGTDPYNTTYNKEDKKEENSEKITISLSDEKTFIKPLDDYYYYNHIGYGNGLYIIMPSSIIFDSANNVGYYSTDYINWHTFAIPLIPGPTSEQTFERFYSMHTAGVNYCNGKFIVVFSDMFSGNDAQGAYFILTSSDGINWEWKDIGVTSFYNGYPNVRGNKILTDSSDDSCTLYSADGGVNWQTVNLGYYGYWISCIGENIMVALGNGICGGNNESYSSYSVDGINWTTTILHNSIPYNFTGVAYGNNIFIASIANESISFDPINYALISEDGINWDQITLPVFAEWIFIEFNNGIFILSGSQGTYYSEDGINWNKLMNENAKLLKVNNNIIAHYTNEEKFRTIEIDNPDNWPKELSIKSLTSSPIGSDIGSIAYGNGVYVAIEETITCGSGIYYYSEDGVNWQQRNFSTPNGGDYFTPAEIKFYNNHFIIILSQCTGASTFGIVYDILISEDGINWILDTLPTTSGTSGGYLLNGNKILTPSIHGNKILISTDDGDTIYSETGDILNPNWISGDISASIGAEQCVIGDTTTVIAEVSSSKFYLNTYSSTNKVDWSKSSSMDAKKYAYVVTAGMAYGKNKFALLCEDFYGTNITPVNIILVSEDGVNWQENELPTNSYWTNIIFNNGVFVISGPNGTYYSEDTVNWDFLCSDPFIGFAPANKNIIAIHEDYSLSEITIKNKAKSKLPQAGDTITISGNTNFYANFEISANYDPVELPTPTHALKRFIGWYLPKDKTIHNGTYTPTSKSHLYALWSLSVEEIEGLYDVYVYKDGSTATAVNLSLPPGKEWSKLVYGKGMYAAISGSTVAYSKDLLNWTEVDSGLEGRLIYSGNYFFIIGHPVLSGGLYGQENEVKISSDCSTWNRCYLAQYIDSFMGDEVTIVWDSIHYDNINNKYCALGIYQDSYDFGGVSSVSSDTLSWTQPEESNGIVSSASGIGIYFKDKFISGAMPPIFTYSFDGLNWLSSEFQGEGYAEAFAASDNTVIALIAAHTNNSITICRSTDGINWNQMLVTSSNHYYNYTSNILYGNGRFVIYSDSKIQISTDEGLTWSEYSIPAHKEITFVKNKFVLQFTSGLMMESTDAINWKLMQKITYDVEPFNEYESYIYWNGTWIKQDNYIYPWSIRNNNIWNDVNDRFTWTQIGTLNWSELAKGDLT